MDKLKMAHDYALKQMESLSENSTMQSLVSVAWQYADAMQAEAEKRNKAEAAQKRKEIREMLNAPNTFVEREGQHFDDVADVCKTYSSSEWQPDWSQAPEWANYIAVYSDHCNASYFEKEPKIISGYTWGGIDGKSLLTPMPVYAGNWQESLRKRPEALCKVDWSAAPKNAFQWQMINNEAYWRIEIMGGLDTEPAPTFGFTGSHIVERPDGF